MTVASALTLKDVTKHFGGIAVVDGVSFDIPVGGRTALIGPNGAGKTTLFNLISGVFPVDSGSIRLSGEPIENVAPRERVRRGLARSFQNIRLMPHLSIIENVMLGQHVQVAGFASRLSPISWQRRNRWRELALATLRDAGVDIEPDADVSNLSYGLRKRIEVVRALMSRPRLLMLDEPVAGLNPRETKDLTAFLKSIELYVPTVLVVEHDMSFVRDLCDRTIVLNFGRAIYDGPTHRVGDDEDVRAAYLGRRRMTGAPSAA